MHFSKCYLPNTNKTVITLFTKCQREGILLFGEDRIRIVHGISDIFNGICGGCNGNYGTREGVGIFLALAGSNNNCRLNEYRNPIHKGQENQRACAIL